MGEVDYSATNSIDYEVASSTAMHHIVGMLAEWHCNWRELQVHPFILSDLHTFLRDWDEHYTKSRCTMSIGKMYEHLRLLEYILTRKTELARLQHGRQNWKNEPNEEINVEDMDADLMKTYSIVEQITLFASGVLPIIQDNRSDNDWVQNAQAKVANPTTARLVDRYAIAWRTGETPKTGHQEEAAPAEVPPPVEEVVFEDGSRKRSIQFNWRYGETPHWHCPACGKNLFGVTGLNGCAHMLIACYEGELIGTNQTGIDMIGGKRPDLVPEETFKDGNTSPYQVLKAAYSTGTNFVLQSTTCGIPGPHPVGNVEILFECRDALLENKKKKK